MKGLSLATERIAVPALQCTRLTVGLAYVAFISMGLSDGFLGIAWPSIRDTFGLPLAALGALSTTITIGALVTSFSSGRLLARLGVGWLLAAGCLFMAASLLAYGLAPLWTVMVGFGLLTGVGSGAIRVSAS
jgi:MFS family permease